MQHDFIAFANARGIYSFENDGDCLKLVNDGLNIKRGSLEFWVDVDDFLALDDCNISVVSPTQVDITGITNNQFRKTWIWSISYYSDGGMWVENDDVSIDIRVNTLLEDQCKALIAVVDYIRVLHENV